MNSNAKNCLVCGRPCHLNCDCASCAEFSAAASTGNVREIHTNLADMTDHFADWRPLNGGQDECSICKMVRGGFRSPQSCVVEGSEHKFSMDDDGELDEVFVKDASVHIERMDEMCFFIGIESPTKHPLSIKTGFEDGEWFFNVTEDSEDGKELMLSRSMALAPVWISVEERLPDPDVDVYIVNRHGEQFVASYWPNCTCETKWHGGNRSKPTHWMPLLSAPTPTPGVVAEWIKISDRLPRLGEVVNVLMPGGKWVGHVCRVDVKGAGYWEWIFTGGEHSGQPISVMGYEMTQVKCWKPTIESSKRT